MKLGKCLFRHITHCNIATGFLSEKFTEEVTESGTENRQRQTGYILVRPQCNGQETVDQSTQCPGSKRNQKGNQGRNHSAWYCTRLCDCLFIVVRANKTGDGAHEHHTFHTKINISGFLRQDFSQCPKKERRSGQHSGNKKTTHCTKHLYSPFPERSDGK